MASDTATGTVQTVTARIARSDYADRVLDRLVSDGPATPSTLAAGTDIDIAHVSRALQQLRDDGGVELLVPEDTKKGRVYGATDAGERALGVMRGE
jgi:DNA-binding MarR family transcriptional regulator